MEERQARGRNFARKFLGFMSSKRKRDEEKKRMDLWKAMRDSSVERLAAVIASARTEFGDQLDDLCSDAEGVLQRLLREGRATGTHRKITLRERLLLADIEASSQQQPLLPQETSTAVPRENCSGNSEIVPAAAAADAPPVIQAVLTLVRPSSTTEIQQQSNPEVAGGEGASLPAQPLSGNQNATSGRRLLSALLWEERNLDGPDQGLTEGWVAFGVTAPIHFDHSRSQSVASELNRVGFHRPSASLDAPPEAAAAAAAAAAAPTRSLSSLITSTPSSRDAGTATVPETPMRVSLMSLLREAEEGGSGIIFMNRQMIDRNSGGGGGGGAGGVAFESPAKEATGLTGGGGSNVVTGDGITMEQTCCVCMGRQKGAAFIPCGHTFCRRCCKELQQARGSCPLCNKEISDVLNLY
ncbi:hypothetical protein SELMODRAFT_447521 [Selaginella moellendorffii]|uniref:RING-type domain-containing protein n=1 Tax=Selaginella moellendorffii TaxID=88036 RepID=D8T052_SELML|nr:uncharacterized protein LOC9662299 [Selaginella moellendorffii]XP_024518503.1 uncharacterized protein LOC9662299 [Selaginella moellendorffii]XP_024518504.1 uncharacterized protein LOC9662299 [Selaginella moellendorffii]EFJ09959.1 hypothetical protein SELMODRAFT_447521 [Selaginella moellendorffii]|eukprot:XP_024518501.1 uncharacterized protein LOC9662299 [Selaginella moellendorffii]